MLSSPPTDEAPDAAELRGNLFNDLDRLAYALELEVTDLLSRGRTEEARARQDIRLGVRLAQRLVTGVWADEVNLRLRETAHAYETRLGMVAS